MPPGGTWVLGRLSLPDGTCLATMGSVWGPWSAGDNLDRTLDIPGGAAAEFLAMLEHGAGRQAAAFNMARLHAELVVRTGDLSWAVDKAALLGRLAAGAFRSDSIRLPVFPEDQFWPGGMSPPDPQAESWRSLDQVWCGLPLWRIRKPGAPASDPAWTLPEGTWHFWSTAGGSLERISVTVRPDGRCTLLRQDE